MAEDHAAIAALNDEAAAIIFKHLPYPAELETKIPGFVLVRRESVSGCDKCLSKPSCTICISGDKKTTLGGVDYHYGSGQSLVTGLDVPGTFNVMDASAQTPFLCMTLYLDAAVFTKLISEHPNLADSLRGIKERPGAKVIATETHLYKAFIRLLSLAFDDVRREVLSPLVIEEIHYLLLTGEAREVLISYNALGIKSNQIAAAINFLKENIQNNIFVDDLARAVNMAPSTFYRRFKETVGISPLQFHKQLRLYEAQRLMISQGINVSSAAYRVGYESTSQFSRDYKRFFGLSPNKDVQSRLITQ